MGGNALPDIPTRRLSAQEFHRLARRLPVDISSAFGVRAQVIPAYHSKPDFGDLDILVESDTLVAREGHAWPEAIESFARNHGHARAVSLNSAVRNERPVIETATFSYDHRDFPHEVDGFQVDLIFQEAAYFDTALNYFSYNDLGNLIGRVAESMGFIYGHKGLLYRLRKGTHLLATVEVTRNTSEALEFMGYDALRFRQGFETLSDIFDYVQSSRYFSTAPFLLENRNHASRTRDRKRSTYSAFLKRLKSSAQPLASEPLVSPEEGLAMAFQMFPAFQKSYNNALLAHDRKEKFRLLFSGHIVGKLTGLKGEALGLFMEAFRNEFASFEKFQDFVIEEGEEGVRSRTADLKRRFISRPSAQPPRKK